MKNQEKAVKRRPATVDQGEKGFKNIRQYRSEITNYRVKLKKEENEISYYSYFTDEETKTESS